MSINRWWLEPKTIFSEHPIIPVVVLHDLADALPMAKALMDGGITILEITLRTPVALAAIQLLRQKLPEALVGVGTVTSVSELHQSIDAGAQFAVSPGLTKELLDAAWKETIPFIPGASNISLLMEGLNIGYSHFKFFPAEALGGITMLNAIYGPFPQLRFCATGGIHEENFMDYLRLPNVSCVGGSWVLPKEVVKEKAWNRIRELARTSMAQTA